MSDKIPSRRERLRRAEEVSEKLKDQFGNAEDIYNDVREVVDTEDPSTMTPNLLNVEEYNRLSELYKRLTPNNEHQPLPPISNDQENGESLDLNTVSQPDTPERRGPSRPSKKPKLEHEPKMGDSWYRFGGC